MNSQANLGTIISDLSKVSGKVECLSRVVKGKTFADVGGLWGTKGEMATVAMRQGARSAAMIDAMPLTIQQGQSLSVADFARANEWYSLSERRDQLPSEVR